jgi:hypothetical protein
MKQIPLSNGMVAVVDDLDHEELSKFIWHFSGGYAVRKIPTAPFSISMHREIIGAEAGQEVDHRNWDGLFNCRENLRICTHAENQSNRGPNSRNSTGYKGVSPHKATGKFQAKIVHNLRPIHLGYFDDAESAARAYDEAALQYHGSFSYQNFPKKEGTNG